MVSKPKKRGRKKDGYAKPPPIPEGEILTDDNGSKWQIGASIGVGGFGEIYCACKLEAAQKQACHSYPYVVKIEPIENGPLFVEMHFYKRNCNPVDIETFKQSRNLSQLGIPTFLGSGTHIYQGTELRFLVLERYGTDLSKIFKEKGRFPAPTVFQLGLQVLDVLEYIHGRSYIHADIKGANILLGAAPGAGAYLSDFGLAYRIVDDNYKPDKKSAHEGTLEYTSRDRHVGAKTMRGDLEILAYNLVQWVAGALPWDSVTDPDSVLRMKTDFVEHVRDRFQRDYPQVPEHLIKFFEYLDSLEMQDVPNYVLCREIFESYLRSVGKTRNSDLVFTVDENPNDGEPVVQTHVQSTIEIPLQPAVEVATQSALDSSVSESVNDTLSINTGAVNKSNNSIDEALDPEIPEQKFYKNIFTETIPPGSKRVRKVPDKYKPENYTPTKTASKRKRIDQNESTNEVVNSTGQNNEYGALKKKKSLENTQETESKSKLKGGKSKQSSPKNVKVVRKSFIQNENFIEADRSSTINNDMEEKPDSKDDNSIILITTTENKPERQEATSEQSDSDCYSQENKKNRKYSNDRNKQMKLKTTDNDNHVANDNLSDLPEISFNTNAEIRGKRTSLSSKQSDLKVNVSKKYLNEEATKNCSGNINHNSKGINNVKQSETVKAKHIYFDISNDLFSSVDTFEGSLLDQKAQPHESSEKNTETTTHIETNLQEGNTRHDSNEFQLKKKRKKSKSNNDSIPIEIEHRTDELKQEITKKKTSNIQDVAKSNAKIDCNDGNLTDLEQNVLNKIVENETSDTNHIDFGPEEKQKKSKHKKKQKLACESIKVADADNYYNENEHSIGKKGKKKKTKSQLDSQTTKVDPLNVFDFVDDQSNDQEQTVSKKKNRIDSRTSTEIIGNHTSATENEPCEDGQEIIKIKKKKKKKDRETDKQGVSDNEHKEDQVETITKSKKRKNVIPEDSKYESIPFNKAKKTRH